MVELVELVDELSEVVARLLNGAHQSHEGHVVALGVELGEEERGLKHGQSIGQRFGVSHDLVIVLKLAGFDSLDVVADDDQTGREHLDGAVLHHEVLRNLGFSGRVAGSGNSSHLQRSYSLVSL